MTTQDSPHGSRSESVLVATIASLAASFIFTALRFFSRVFVLKKTSWDDYFILLGWVLSFGLSFSVCYASQKGLGKPDADIPDIWRPALSQAQWAFTVLYNPALMATKTSVLFFYLTMSGNTQQVFRWITIGTLVFANVAGFAFTILNITQCRPLHLVFQYPLPAAYCTDIVKLSLSAAPANLITDVAILFLPMPLLTGLHLPRRQKIILVGVFGLGIFVTAVDVLRIVYLEQAMDNNLNSTRMSPLGPGGLPVYTHSSFTKYENLAWYASLSFMWSAIEANVAIICVCIPTLKPLCVLIWPRLLSGEEVMMKKHVAADTRHAQTKGPRDGNSDIKKMDFHATVGSNVNPTTYNDMNVDFIQMDVQKSLVNLSHRESIPPLLATAFLSIILGLAYGFINSLNCSFESVVVLPALNVHLQRSAYYWGYALAPPTLGLHILRRGGFRPAFITGLFIYSCGLLVFWPSSIIGSFPAYLVSNFITGIGLSVIEIARNPFACLCGPPDFAEIRLLLMFAIEAFGATIAPILYSKILRNHGDPIRSLVKSQYAYLVIALMCFSAALVFYYVPLPKASDDDLEELASKRSAVNNATIRGFKIKYITLAVGTLALFFFIGGRESVAIMTFRKPSAPNALMPKIRYVGYGCYAAGSFIGVALMLIIKPRKIIPFYQIGCMVTAVLAMSIPPKTKNAYINIDLAYLFEAAIYPTIFAMCLRGLGSKTRLGATIMVMTNAAGALFPAVMSPIMEHQNQYGWFIMVMCFSCALLFPIYINLVPKARNQTDPEKRFALSDIWSNSNQDTTRVSESDNAGVSALSSLSEGTGRRDSGCENSRDERGNV